jgi:Na+(H+)/acetate symporter ActP
MSQTAIIWALIVLACVTANLPFVNHRLMTVLPLRGATKSLAWRLVELVAWYFIVGGIGLAFEKSVGQIQAQGWEFYAVTGALFLTLAFPGFVYRYLLRRGN